MSIKNTLNDKKKKKRNYEPVKIILSLDTTYVKKSDTNKKFLLKQLKCSKLFEIMCIKSILDQMRISVPYM